MQMSYFAPQAMTPMYDRPFQPKTSFDLQDPTITN
jgi:hypothetical protein